MSEQIFKHVVLTEQFKKTHLTDRFKTKLLKSLITNSKSKIIHCGGDIF